MPRNKAQPKPHGPPPTVSARWLLMATSITVVAAAACAWGALCLLFWQGSWQLLYHPASAVTRTPVNIGLPYNSVGFAVTASGSPQLHGWWIPYSSESHYTAIYLHGADGNLGDIVDALIPLRAAELNLFAFDYRGYGMSSFKRPSEARWREDAESAIEYLTKTRHIPASSILLFGRGLGANLALEVAAAHPELGGLVMDEPLPTPVDAIFRDPRARLVPARLLVRDRFDWKEPAAALAIPSLWFYEAAAPGIGGPSQMADAFREVGSPKMLVWLTRAPDAEKDQKNALVRWLDDLPNKTRKAPVANQAAASPAD